MSSTSFHLGKVVGKLKRLPSFLWTLEARFRGIQMAGPVTFLGRPILSVFPGSHFSLGGGNGIFSEVRCNLLGNFQPCVLRTLAAGAQLRIGSKVGMSGSVVCAAASIQIGEGTILGSGALIIDNDFHVAEGEFGWGDGSVATARPIVIGRGCFIGARAIVLKGVTIGDRAVVGAGAVVTKDVPPGLIAVGNPARNVAPGQDRETAPQGTA